MENNPKQPQKPTKATKAFAKPLYCCGIGSSLSTQLRLTPNMVLRQPYELNVLLKNIF